MASVPTLIFAILIPNNGGKMEITYVIICAILMLPGIAGVIIPAVPGIPYMFIVALVYSILTKFSTIDSTEIIVLAIITVASLVVDYSTGLLGAKYGGAGKKSLFWGLSGSIIGTIIFPPLGGIAGLFIAILLAEILAKNDHKKALKAASGGLLGSLAGIIINICLAITYLVCFLFFALR